MDRHKSLYKDNSTLMSPKTQRLNRERNAIRAQQRNDRFHSGRNISVSPTPRKPKNLLVGNTIHGQGEDNKENSNLANVGAHTDASSMHSSRIAKVACKTDAQKLTRQEMYLQRFIEWKEAKKQQEELKKQKQGFKKPFMPYVGSSGPSKTAPKSTTTAANSFVPKNHQFKAPEGLKNPATATTFNSNTTNPVKKRKSHYTALPTPPKKKPDQKIDLKKFPIARKALPSNHLISRPPGVTPGKPLTSTVQKKTTTVTKVETTNAPGTSTRKTPGVSQNPHTNVNTKSTAKGPAGASAKPPENQRFTKPRPFILPPPPQNNRAAKPKPLIIPPPPPPTATSSTNRARIVKPIRGGGAIEKTGGAVGKAKALQASKLNDAAPKNKKLSVCMKAKKGTIGNSSSGVTSTAASKQLTKKLKINKNTLLDVPQLNLPIAETPTDFTNSNSYGLFVTSTTLKSSTSSHNSQDFIKDPSIGDTISPIEPLQNGSAKRDSAVKRMLMQDPESKAMKKDSNSGSEKKRKFNFVRYSEACSEMPLENTSPVEKEDDKIDAKADENKEEANLQIVEQSKDRSIKTPEKVNTNEENAERPINYLSPFVSVTRGKVNSKKEREKRNSIYLLGNQMEAEAPIISADEIAKREAEIVLRRTMETVRYFRKQLHDEIDRLHTLCDKWETYKTENLSRLQETGGEDMINVTIGQTKLLTSKKFMQFSGLIDRCEKGATSEGPVDDGSEDTKAINPVDLEGFWSMVGLQVDNVDKRFKNLERWRANDWIDPDEVKPKVKKVKKAKATATAGAKAKPNGALQEMLRKAHAEMRAKKAQAAAAAATTTSTAAVEGDSSDIVLTPSRKRRSQNTTPQRHSASRRISIIVKNRKLHSAAPTILTINSPVRRVSLSRKTENLPQDSPKIAPIVDEFKRSLSNLQKLGERNELWKTALKGADQQRRMSLAVSATPPPSNTPQAINGRKSILKTPGTAKGKPKNVIFNEELRIKKFKFTIDSDQSEDDDVEESKPMDSNTGQCEGDEDKRTYSLRTRKVVLRPSSEFEIPK